MRFLPEILCLALWATFLLIQVSGKSPLHTRRQRESARGRRWSICVLVIIAAFLAPDVYRQGDKWAVFGLLSLPPAVLLPLILYSWLRAGPELKAQRLLANREAKPAEQVIRNCIENSGPTLGRYNILGLALMIQERWHEAIAAFDAAARLRDNPTVRANKALALWKSGSPESALPIMEEARKERPDDPTLALNLCQLHAEQGRIDEARSLLREAEELCARSPAHEEMLEAAREACEGSG